MISHPKTIRISIGDRPYFSTKAPETIDEFDGHCPACGSNQYAEVLTIVQHGFIDDECITLMSCAKCFETFHYWYTVEAACLDECRSDIPGFRPPIGG